MSRTATLGVVMVSGLATLLAGQVGTPTTEELRDRKRQKLAEPWLKNADWSLSFAGAKARARQDGKLIFAYFTRSFEP